MILSKPILLSGFTSVMALATVIGLATIAHAPSHSQGSHVQAITDSVLATYHRGEHPLPVAGLWNSAYDAFGPTLQMQLIADGHFLIPCFSQPGPSLTLPGRYYTPSFDKAASLHLPICFISSQWESLFSKDPAFFHLGPDQTPFVVSPEGKIGKAISPFGPIGVWRKLGQYYGGSRALRLLQKRYPDPPRVIFLSNNEPPRLGWQDAEKSRRYLRLFGKGRSDDFKRKVFGDAWIKRYRAMHEGFRQALVNPNWKKKAIFVGYDALLAPLIGGQGWLARSLVTRDRLTPWSLAWDGASISYYIGEFGDNTTLSPDIGLMNAVPVKNLVIAAHPDYWFEISVWDEYEPGEPADQRSFLKPGHHYGPARYGGVVQFGMWLLRPRLVRFFEKYTVTPKMIPGYFQALLAAVDRVHTNSVLRDFWQHGRLVANTAHQNIYAEKIPPQIKNKERWFLLDANVNPPWPWNARTELKVFALALVQGQAPHRRWLIYAHAPAGTVKDVSVCIPGYKTVKIKVTPAGSFYTLDEGETQAKRLPVSAVATSPSGPHPHQGP